jgi:hypothetical protein
MRKLGTSGYLVNPKELCSSSEHERPNRLVPVERDPRGRTGNGSELCVGVELVLRRLMLRRRLLLLSLALHGRHHAAGRGGGSGVAVLESK